MNQRVNPSIWLLVVCSAISPLAITVVVPANSAIMRTFAAEYGVAQLMLTAFLITMGVAQLFVGYLSDKFGRRPVMLWGLVVFSIGSLASAIAPTLEVLLAGRLLQGLGGAATVAIPRAIVRDLYSREESSSIMSYLALATQAVPVLAPAVGGLVLEHYSWRLLFVGLLVTAIVVGIIVAKTLPETAPENSGNKPEFFSSSAKLLSHPGFIGYGMSCMFGASMYHAFNAGAPYLMMETLGRSTSEYGLYFIIAATGFLLGTLTSARISQRIGADRMILLAIIPIVIGLSLFWLLSSWAHPLALFAPMTFITFSNGFTVPNALSGAVSVYPELAGTAAGLGGFLMFTTGAAITMIVGFVQNDTIWPLVITLSISGLLTITGALLGMRYRP